MVGSPAADNEGGINAGSVYFFDVACSCADLADYARFQRCFSSEGGGLFSGCEALDFDVDGDVDLQDFCRFQVCFTGEGSSELGMECCSFD